MTKILINHYDLKLPDELDITMDAGLLWLSNYFSSLNPPGLSLWIEYIARRNKRNYVTNITKEYVII